MTYCPTNRIQGCDVRLAMPCGSCSCWEHPQSTADEVTSVVHPGYLTNALGPNNRSKFNVALGIEAQGFCMIKAHQAPGP